MGEGFQFVDLIFFAMVAVFLVLRLRSVLGRRPDEGASRPAPENPSPFAGSDNDNVIDLPRRLVRGVSGDEDDPSREQAAPPTPLEAALARIRDRDRGFSAEDFLAGAKAAFEMIIGAFATGDAKALQPLLSKQVLANFTGAMEERVAAGNTLEAELVASPTAEIVDASLDGNVATVTVRFVSEQVNVLRNKDGDVIEGDPNRITKVIDIWTFSRDTGARDPNWALVETRSGD
ncbi:MAG: Tim44 domain-containing protein [Alphaproteobacteria bacterium]|nr:Tim44 domain-containing protein [Alphaproteobacteria bacterium]MBF0129641.1 Tim44 domain-containing protein [Alphaproteobacteria bacterium]